jgi:excisionase family DNA binding protein
MKDIVRYLERREIHPEKYKLPPGSYSGTYAVKPLLPESVTTEELRKYYIESFRDIPDIVSTREAAELTGATASTVAKWIRTKKLKALSHGPAFIIPKVNLIDFMASDAYLNKRLKSQKFHENIGGFLSWKAENNCCSQPERWGSQDQHGPKSVLCAGRDGQEGLGS